MYDKWPLMYMCKYLMFDESWIHTLWVQQSMGQGCSTHSPTKPSPSTESLNSTDAWLRQNMIDHCRLMRTRGTSDLGRFSIYLPRQSIPIYIFWMILEAVRVLEERGIEGEERDEVMVREWKVNGLSKLEWFNSAEISDFAVLKRMYKILCFLFYPSNAQKWTNNATRTITSLSNLIRPTS